MEKTQEARLRANGKHAAHLPKATKPSRTYILSYTTRLAPFKFATDGIFTTTFIALPLPQPDDIMRNAA
jgi:hypothetical protein